MPARAASLPGIAAVELDSARSFPRHAHDQWGIGVMIAGGHRSWSCLGQVEAEAGDTIAVNPGEMHDGAPLGGVARRWRMLFIDPALAAGWLAPEAGAVLPDARPAARDPLLPALFAEAFAHAVAPAPDRLAAEAALLRLLAAALRRHGLRRLPPLRATPGVARARARLDEAPECPATLAELAALAGCSRFQLLRGFARETGATPHAYQMQQRVRLARRLLAAGRPIAEAALAAGFADQSHLTRAFVRQLGITPGRFRAAC